MIVRLADIDRALERYIRGELSSSQLTGWAEFLEMNVHVVYEQKSEQQVADILFRIATPEVNGPLDECLVEELRRDLGQPPSS